jgi:hypothetical protein
MNLANPAEVIAEAERRRQRRAAGLVLHEAPPNVDEESIDEPDVHWKKMQADVRLVFVDDGCAVYWLSQARKTGQTPGVPDLIIFGPPGHPFMAFWETKAGQGKLSPAQKQFQLQCLRAGVRFGSGGVNAAKRYLAKWRTA